MILLSRLSLALALGALLTGCAGYQLGPTNGTPAGSRSVEVALFPNRTLEPRLSEPHLDGVAQRAEVLHARDVRFEGQLPQRGEGHPRAQGAALERRG